MPSVHICAALAAHERKLYKMRELRGARHVTVKYFETAENTADLFTKVLQLQPFEKPVVYVPPLYSVRVGGQ